MTKKANPQSLDESLESLKKTLPGLQQSVRKLLTIIQRARDAQNMDTNRKDKS